MPENERSEPTPEQIKYVLQQAILRNYPNPERRGCPGREALEAMAERKRPPEDRHWEHVTHCSPCYQEFLHARSEVLERRRARRRIRTVGIAAGVAAMGLTTALFVLRPGDQVQKPPQVANQRPAQSSGEKPASEPVMTAAVLNFASVERGDSGTTEGDGLQRVPRDRVALSVYLPLGNEPGEYQVRLLRKRTDQSPLAEFSHKAEIRDGLVVLRITPDLSNLEPGAYVLALRAVGGSWRFQPFLLQ